MGYLIIQTHIETIILCRFYQIHKLRLLFLHCCNAIYCKLFVFSATSGTLQQQTITHLFVLYTPTTPSPVQWYIFIINEIYFFRNLVLCTTCHKYFFVKSYKLFLILRLMCVSMCVLCCWCCCIVSLHRFLFFLVLHEMQPKEKLQNFAINLMPHNPIQSTCIQTNTHICCIDDWKKDINIWGYKSSSGLTHTKEFFVIVIKIFL